MLRRTLLVNSLIAAPLLTLLAACGPGKQSFNNTDITGSTVGGNFSLIDHTGAPRTLADYKGKVVAIFFGFTRCPDICPTNMLEWAEIMKQLGPDADRVQVLFVTVDPERDTQQVLAGYVPAFDKRFVGLYAKDAAATKAVADTFKVFYAKAGDTSGMNYTIDHTAASYVLDQTGKPRLYVKHGQANVANTVADIRTLLKG